MQALIKKLLRFYLLAVLMVLLYFLLKILMPEEEKTLPSKSFPAIQESQPITSKERREVENPEGESKETLILLPRK